jgi:hypothetical protein
VKWLYLKIFIAAALLLVGFFGYEYFAGSPEGLTGPWYDTNPHMKWQPHLRSFDAAMPLPPPGAVPASGPSLAIPSPREAEELFRAGRQKVDLEAGKVYYGYYCLMCHGELGDGNGPVGESYVPKPADLRDAKFRAYTDGRLLRAMLAGSGHDVPTSPGATNVLGYTVPPPHRVNLVRYVRTFGSPATRQADKGKS